MGRWAQLSWSFGEKQSEGEESEEISVFTDWRRRMDEVRIDIPLANISVNTLLTAMNSTSVQDCLSFTIKCPYLLSKRHFAISQELMMFFAI